MATITTQPDHDSGAATTPPGQKSYQESPSEPPTGNTLIKTILARHSTRVFRPDAVPMNIIEECLELAQHSPSSTNMQPWRLTFTAGAKLDRIRKAMMDAVLSGVPSTVPAIPDEYKHYRSEIGHAMYGPDGYNIPRSDREGTRKAQLKNYEFFGAPLMAVIGIDERIHRGSDAMSVGLYVQTLVLLLTERGLGTCLEVSTSGYADVLRKELGIPDNIFVLSTLAIGYEDGTQHINTLKMSRDTWRDHVDFVME